MATISSSGIGSGLDVSTIITSLMAIERRPLDLLETAETKIQSQISALGQISSALSSFRDLAGKLASSTFWKQTSGSSSASAVGITTSGSATKASYSVEVQSLAKAQAVATSTFAASTDTLGAGTLHLELGSWDAGQTSFTPDAETSAVDIAIAQTDTLADIRDKINAAGAGVSATLLTDASGVRLVMRSSSTGAESGFRATVTTSAGSLDTLAYDPPNVAGGATLTQAAANAQATIDGLAVSSASNTLTDVMDGVTLSFNAVTTAPVTVGVAADTDSMRKTLEEFASAYSKLASLIKSNTKYDASSAAGATLQGDSTVVGVHNAMRSILGAASGASTAFARLSDAGFELQQDGSLTVNATKLDNALDNLPELQKLFANSDLAEAGNDGFGKRFKAFADALLGIDGTLTARKDGLDARLDRNQDQQERMEQRLEQTQKRLEAQYTALDAKMGTLSSLSSYITQQVAIWSKSTS